MPFPSNNLYNKDNDMNLLDFRKTINDVSRSYLFMIEMPNIDTDARKLTSFARSTTMPGYNIEETSFKFQTATINLGYGAVFNDWSVEFLNDQVYSLRSKFLAWMSQIYDPVRVMSMSANSYKYDGVKVHQLSRTGKKVQTCQFVGLFPKSISDISLKHDATELQTFTVNFSYDYFTIDSGNPLEAAIDLATGNTDGNGIGLSGIVGRAPSAGTPQNNVAGSFDVYGGMKKSNSALI